MSDPAVEAAQRAWALRYGENNQMWFTDSLAGDGFASRLVDAAREALEPLKKLHQMTVCEEDGPLCFECESPWPCATAKLTYREDEL